MKMGNVVTETSLVIGSTTVPIERVPIIMNNPTTAGMFTVSPTWKIYLKMGGEEYRVLTHEFHHALDVYYNLLSGTYQQDETDIGGFTGLTDDFLDHIQYGMSLSSYTALMNAGGYHLNNIFLFYLAHTSFISNNPGLITHTKMYYPQQ